MSMIDNLSTYLSKMKSQTQLPWDDLADDIGLGKSTLTNYRKKNANPRLDTLEQLCISLHATPNQLLLGDCLEAFLLEHVIPVAYAVSQLPFEKQILFVDLFTQLLQLWEPTGSDAPEEAASSEASKLETPLKP